MFLYYTQTPTPIPLGIYDVEDAIPGVDSIEIPSGEISRWLRDATAFLERLDDAVPGLGSFLKRMW